MTDHTQDTYVSFALDTKRPNKGWRKVAGPANRIEVMIKARSKIVDSRYNTLTLRVLENGKYFHPARLKMTSREIKLSHPDEDKPDFKEITKSCNLSDKELADALPALPLTPDNSYIHLFEEYHSVYKDELLMQQVLVQYLPGILKDIAGRLQREITKLYDAGMFSRDTFTIAGNKVKAQYKTLTLSTSDSPITYKYGGTSRTTAGKTGKYLRQAIRRMRELFDFRFNLAFINVYNGNEALGWHADSEKGIVTDDFGGTTIVGINLGETRNVQFRKKYRSGKEDPSEVHSLEVSHGDVYSMQQQTQLLYKHRACKGKGRRIAITLRKMKKE